MRRYAFGIAYLIPPTAVIGYLLGGLFAFLTPLVVFLLIPSLDLLMGVDRWNPPEGAEDDGTRDPLYRIWTWVALPVQVALVIWALAVARWGDPGVVQFVGLAVSVGVCSGAIGITVAHELVHRYGDWERWLGSGLLLLAGYMHWGIEHVAGHHRHVATPEDAATARFGESLYRFLPRTIAGGARSAWRIEAARLARLETGVWSPDNRILRQVVGVAVALVAIGLVFGWLGLLLFVIQAAVAILLLEIVNYVEHYGLLRMRGEDGRYERIRPHHSWNSGERLTNFFVFNLQRHSDHHAAPRRRYPQLPTGYAGMVLLALIPPQWFRVMDPRVPEAMRSQAAGSA